MRKELQMHTWQTDALSDTSQLFTVDPTDVPQAPLNEAQPTDVVPKPANKTNNKHEARVRTGSLKQSVPVG